MKVRLIPGFARCESWFDLIPRRSIQKPSMQWALITLAGALSFSGVSALIDSAIDTKVIAHPRAHLYGTGNIVNTVAQQFEERNATTPNLDSRSSHHLLPRQAAGRCGAEFSNQRCGGNQCCSSYGYCGSEFEVRIFVPRSRCSTC